MSAFTKAVVCICTRPDSARVPRKALRKVAGLPAIEHILTRIGAVKGSVTPYPVILAVPTGCQDYDYLLAGYNVSIFRGNPTSPLHRMVDAVLDWSEQDDNTMPKFVIRITHDDLLIDMTTVNGLVDETEHLAAGYGISPGIVDGAGVEVIFTGNLLKAAQEMRGQDVEHISYFVRGAGMPSGIVLHKRPRASIERPYRLTLDYPEDAVVLESVLRQTGPLAPLDEVCRFLDLHGEILKHNALPAVSVYICARNAEKWIQDAIRSVPETCSFGAVELVVVDDASTDATLLKILEVSSRVNRLIVNEDNIGLASSSNVGLKACRARYVMRLDADDRLKPGAIDFMLRRLQEQSAAIVYAGYDEMNESGGVVTASGCDPRTHHHAGAALMDAKMINELRFRDGLRHWDGLELYNRVRAAQMPVAYCDVPLWFYRRHSDSMSRMTPERAAAREAIEGLRP